MKKTIICAGMLLFIFGAACAQTVKSYPASKTQKTVKAGQKQSKSKSTYASGRGASLSSTSEHQAKAATEPAAVPRLVISDPTIRALNARANGSDIRISNSGIVGMPKRAYGFANGRITLSTTGATSSGTITGSGSVGSGSSLGNIGSNGPGIGLNGKSPYAGTNMWGNAGGLSVTNGEPGVRRPVISKNK